MKECNGKKRFLEFHDEVGVQKPSKKLCLANGDDGMTEIPMVGVAMI